MLWRWGRDVWWETWMLGMLPKHHFGHLGRLVKIFGLTSQDPPNWVRVWEGAKISAKYIEMHIRYIHQYISFYCYTTNPNHWKTPWGQLARKKHKLSAMSQVISFDCDKSKITRPPQTPPHCLWRNTKCDMRRVTDAPSAACVPAGTDMSELLKVCSCNARFWEVRGRLSSSGFVY